jgi:hypothetical protein
MTNDGLFVAGGFFSLFFSLSYPKKYLFFLVVTHFLLHKKIKKRKKKGKSNPKYKRIHMKKSPKNYPS